MQNDGIGHRFSAAYFKLGLANDEEGCVALGGSDAHIYRGANRSVLAGPIVIGRYPASRRVRLARPTAFAFGVSCQRCRGCFIGLAHTQSFAPSVVQT